MQKITSTTGLKNAIQLLEAEKAVNEMRLKDQFHVTYESFKPVNLFKSTLKDTVSSSFLIDNILVPAVGLATGFISKKIVVGSSGNVFRKLFGVIFQLGITKVVSQHPDAIKSFGQFVFQHIFRKKEMNSEKP